MHEVAERCSAGQEAELEAAEAAYLQVRAGAQGSVSSWAVWWAPCSCGCVAVDVLHSVPRFRAGLGRVAP